MKMQSYYTNSIEESNKSVEDTYLFVNCTGVCVLDGDFEGRNDTGRNDYYILYLNKGKMNIGLDGKFQPMKGGELVVFSPKTPYFYNNNEKNSQVEYIWLHFSGFEAKKMLEKTAVECNKILTVGFDERIIESFAGLFDEYKARDTGFEASCVSRLIALCVLFGRCIKKASGKGENPNLSASVNYIHKNYNSNINVEFLAKMEHLSLGYYRQVFKRRTGMSPVDYITGVRLRHGCELISRTNLSIKEIAALVGYDDQMYFSRIFKKKLGVSPKNYRK